MQTDNLIEMFNDYHLNNSQINEFNLSQHIRLDGLCNNEEIEQYRNCINTAFQDKKSRMEEIPLGERDTYGKAFIQISNLWVDYPDVARFVLAKRFAGVAAQLLGVEAVRIYHDQALYKEAGGGFTPWHQDQHYWPLDCEQTITMWMPLVDIAQEMGTLNFASGSGVNGYLANIPISDKSEKIYEDYCLEHAYEQVNYGAMKAGDATWHSGWCLHGAPANKSDILREVITIIYFPDGTKLLPDPDPQGRWNNNRYDDLERWFPACKAGDMAASILNPRL
jgi:hypothetical protein